MNKFLDFTGEVLECNSKDKEELVLDYLNSYDSLYFASPLEGNALSLVGGVQVKDKDKFILDFVEFLENNGMYFLGYWE